jgi:ribosomal protein L4
MRQGMAGEPRSAHIGEAFRREGWSEFGRPVKRFVTVVSP